MRSVSIWRGSCPREILRFDVDTHAFFLWQDPRNLQRALLFGGNAGSRCTTRGGSPSCPLSVWDISPVRNGQPPVTLDSGPHGYTAFPPPPENQRIPAGGLHSLSVSNDGTRAFYALLNGGFAVVDVSDFARGAAAPQPRPITADESRPTWPGPGAHSTGRPRSTARADGALPPGARRLAAPGGGARSRRALRRSARPGSRGRCLEPQPDPIHNP